MDNFLKKILRLGAGKKLGVYFARDSVSLVEVKDRSIVSYAQIPLSAAESVTPGQPLAEGAFSGGIQNAAAIEEALRKNKIKTKRVFLGLASQDQLIRSFQMLILGASEINLGIQFEVKKYIPFRTEDLAFDYQYRVNKKAGKMDVLFVAATRNNLDKYFASLNEAGLTVAAVEPASLSLLRILSLTKQLDVNTSFALVEVHDQKAEFTIIDKGFPCFSREITMAHVPGVSETAKVEESVVRGRLSSEIRVSLDYFRRQFLGGPVDKVLFLSKDFAMQEGLISGLSQDLGLPVERVELEKYPQLNNAQDLDILKAYALALKGSVKLNLTVDLAKKRLVQPALIEEGPKKIRQASLSISLIKWSVIAALGAAGLVWTLPQSKISKANAKLNQLRGELEGVLLPQLKGLTLEAGQSAKADYNSKIELIEKLLKSRFNLVPSLNVLPKAIERGLWLENLTISVRDGYVSLSLKGAVYLGGRAAEANAANDFYQALKRNPDFMRGLRNLELRSLSEGEVPVGKEKYTVTQFEISGS